MINISNMLLRFFLQLIILLVIVGCGDDDSAGPGIPDPNTMTDIDGNTYRTVTIGSQVWMAENLKVTHYRNGDSISHVIDSIAWLQASSGAYCNYENDAGLVATYGRLYNWFAIEDGRNIAPAGWHVPSDAEWKQLEMFLGMSLEQADSDGFRGTDEGGKLKESGTVHWSSPNTGATNESGFLALPGGARNQYAHFTSMGVSAFFWTSTYRDEGFVWGRGLSTSSAVIGRFTAYKAVGFSIRCIKD